MTGVVLPFINSALEPLVFIVYNSVMTHEIVQQVSKLKARAAGLLPGPRKQGVRFAVELHEHEQEDGCRPTRVYKSRLSVTAGAEFKDSDPESDSSVDSFEYEANRHKSRRYR